MLLHIFGCHPTIKTDATYITQPFMEGQEHHFMNNVKSVHKNQFLLYKKPSSLILPLIIIVNRMWIPSIQPLASGLGSVQIWKGSETPQSIRTKLYLSKQEYTRKESHVPNSVNCFLICPHDPLQIDTSL